MLAGTASAAMAAAPQPGPIGRNLDATALARLLLTSSEGAAAVIAQPGQIQQVQERRVLIEPQPVAPGSLRMRLNPSGRPVTLIVPAKDGAIYLGDINITIDALDRIEFSAQRLLDLLSNTVDPAVLQALQASFAGSPILRPSDLESAGIGISYDPQDLALELDIAAERRATQNLQVTPVDRAPVGDFEAPAAFSAYMNVRGNLDYVSDGFDRGLSSPVLFLDGATRLGAVVLESEAIWDTGGRDRNFQRSGTRLVLDDQRRLVRWTAGDLQPVGRAFQSAPDIAGLSIFRSYSVLQPQRIVRPRGDRSFRLERASTVEVQVNGQIIRRLHLPPGNYDLRDFPFTQGANDIRLSILDDAGRREMLRFNVFLDQSQLARGLSEFGIYAGVLSPLAQNGPEYSNDPAFTGFYRRGITDYLTLGANIQSDKDSRLGGLEGVVATPLGTIAGNFSLSQIDKFGTGYGALVTFQRLIQRSGGQSDSVNLSLEYRSADFGPMGTIKPFNAFRWEVGGGYSHAFNDAIYAGIDGRYSKGRGQQRDIHNLRGTVGWRISPTLNFTVDSRWERDSLGSRVSGLFSLTVRIGRYSTVRADYDTHSDRTRLSFNTLRGQGVGAFNVAADVERSAFGSGMNLVTNYFTNRAEVGISHFGSYSRGFGSSTNQRSSLRLASSLAFADGAFSVGRPIYDSFALVRPHPGLRGAAVLIDPTTNGYTANSAGLGTALQPSLSSYAERTITIDAPAAPAGVDLGTGSFRLFPPYKSGYLLEVGSGYNITALGRLLNRDGEPVSLVTGAAIELAKPDRQPVQLFTNREGRFGAVGLAAGRWRITMADDDKSTFIIDVPESAIGVLKLGDLAPLQDGG